MKTAVQFLLGVAAVLLAVGVVLIGVGLWARPEANVNVETHLPASSPVAPDPSPASVVVRDDAQEEVTFNTSQPNGGIYLKWSRYPKADCSPPEVDLYLSPATTPSVPNLPPGPVR